MIVENSKSGGNSVVPGFVLAAGRSGSGKTTVTAGLLRAFAKRGVKTQPFKVGPDFIDPSYATLAARRACRNVDPFLTGERTAIALYRRAVANADLAVVEGVMGLYDGIGVEGRFSTAYVARLLGLPVVLVVAAEGATSTAATVRGLATFPEGAPSFSGVIVNGAASERHGEMVREAIERYAGLPVFGILPQMSEIAFPSRHLGLVPAMERREFDEQVERLADAVERAVDLERLVSAVHVVSLPREEFDFPRERFDVRVAVARDRAFSFYYEDGLDLLRQLGAELVFTSPLEEREFPDCDALYLGGGYPEEFAQELTANVSYRASLRRMVETGLPTYAECGGMMYLGREIVDRQGKAFPMAKVLDVRTEMGTRLRRFGYVEATACTENLLSEAGETVRGHEFHYSAASGEEACAYEVHKVSDSASMWREGYVRRDLLASYVHLHFCGHVVGACRFLGAAARRRKWVGR